VTRKLQRSTEASRRASSESRDFAPVQSAFSLSAGRGARSWTHRPRRIVATRSHPSTARRVCLRVCLSPCCSGRRGLSESTRRLDWPFLLAPPLPPAAARARARVGGGHWVPPRRGGVYVCVVHACVCVLLLVPASAKGQTHRGGAKRNKSKQPLPHITTKRNNTNTPNNLKKQCIWP
jgi:hypothetical protein